jgi:hypothetical protein
MMIDDPHNDCVVAFALWADTQVCPYHNDDHCRPGIPQWSAMPTLVSIVHHCSYRETALQVARCCGSTSWVGIALHRVGKRLSAQADSPKRETEVRTTQKALKELSRVSCFRFVASAPFRDFVLPPDTSIAKLCYTRRKDHQKEVNLCSETALSAALKARRRRLLLIS